MQTPASRRPAGAAPVHARGWARALRFAITPFLAGALLSVPASNAGAQAAPCDSALVARGCIAGASVAKMRARMPIDTRAALVAPPGVWRAMRRDAWSGAKWGALVGGVANGIACASDDGCDSGGRGSAIAESAVWGVIGGAAFGAMIGAVVGAVRSAR